MSRNDVTQALASVLKVRNYSPRTEEAYIGWANRFIEFNYDRHPSELSEPDVVRFLTHLAVDLKLSASTQNQALNGLVFMYRHVVKRPLGDITSAVRAKTPKRLPVVLAPEDVSAILFELSDPCRLMAALMYGTGLRVMEALSLRMMDIDFGDGHLTVRNAKGRRDRRVPLPEILRNPLSLQQKLVISMHNADLKRGYGQVLKTDGTNLSRHLGLQYLFPSSKLQIDDTHSVVTRSHYRRSTFQKSFRQSVHRAGIKQPATPHSLRHAFATVSLKQGMDIRRLQQILGHASLETTMIYTHTGAQFPITRNPLEDIFVTS